MAKRRMFSISIVESDQFLNLSHSAQILYFHLCLAADDDGFVNQVKSIQKITDCSDDDLQSLIDEKYLLPFENGVMVISHWLAHNYIAKDRYTETRYKKEKATLYLDENKTYVTCYSSVYDLCTQNRLDKRSVKKDNDMFPASMKTYDEDIEIIISYLNKKIGSKFTTNSKSTRSYIIARMNEGFTVDDFISVIEKKCNDWLNNGFQKYLRPKTLFSEKFEKYLKEISSSKEVINEREEKYEPFRNIGKNF